MAFRFHEWLFADRVALCGAAFGCAGQLGVHDVNDRHRSTGHRSAALNATISDMGGYR
jgi:hypothetical protein